MAPAGWRYIATRLNGDGTETLLSGGLPLRDIQLSEVLSGVDDFSATVPLEFDRLKGDTGDWSLFTPWSTAIYAELDGEIRGGWIVVDVDVDNNTLKVNGDGFVGYLHGLPYDGIALFENTDPLVIARHIWAHVQGRPRGNLGLKVVCTPTSSPLRTGKVPPPTKEGQAETTTEGQPEPLRLEWFTDFDLGQRWDDLAQLGKFDYLVEHRWVGDTIEHTLTVAYGGFGRRRDDLRFVVGENVAVVPVVEVRGADYSDHVIALGAGEGRTMIRGEWQSASQRLRRPLVVTDKTLRTKAAADRVAATRGSRVSPELRGDVRQLVVRSHPNAPIGSFRPGDSIRLIGAGRGWAGSLDLWVRILDLQFSPDNGETMTCTVTRTERSLV